MLKSLKRNLGEQLMKKILVLQSMLIVALYAHTAYAIYYSNRTYGPRQSENTKRTGSIDVSPEEKQARKARRDALAKSKRITYSKVEIPEGAVSRITPTSPAIPIDRESRIESLCGFELGRVIKLTREPVLDDDGNIEVVVKLKKPFRFCTHAELRYSKINHCLYYIKLYSAPREKMNDEEVLAEVEGMAEAFTKKFGDRFSQWIAFNPDISRMPEVKSGKRALWKAHSGQSLCIKAHEDVIDQSRTAFKGAAVKPNVKRGWTFSVELVDATLRDLDVESPNRDRSKDTVEGADVL